MNFVVHLTQEMQEIVVMLATVIAPVKKLCLVLKTKSIAISINLVKVLEVKLALRDFHGVVLMKFHPQPAQQQLKQLQISLQQQQHLL